MGFFSKKLEPPQKKYSAFDRELFAVYASIRHFRHQLEGQKFAVWTDLKPLTFALHRVSEPWSARQQRQLSYIAEYTNTMVHVPGKDNVVADALSRPQHLNVLERVVNEGGCARPPRPPSTPSGSSSTSSSFNISPLQLQTLPGIDYTAIGAEQASCEATCKLRASGSLKVQEVRCGTVVLWCDMSTGKPRPLIPAKYQKAVFNILHGLAHPGIRATKRLVAARAVWRGLATDVTAWCRDCQACQRAKMTRQPRAQIQPIDVPTRRFSHVHVDIVGPLPTSAAGYGHLFMMIDRSARWIEAVTLLSTSTAACVDALLACWVACFGVPAQITSDMGVQFTSDV